MTKTPPQSKKAPSKRQNKSPVDDRAVQEQLARLFGQSLFGSWPELESNSGNPQGQRLPIRWLRAALVALVIVAAALGTPSFFTSKIEHRDDPHREQYIEDLKAFFNDGNLEQASQFAKLVESNSGNRQALVLDPKDVHLEAIIAVEAALYRYYDASPERLHRLRPYLDDTNHGHAIRQAARLTILSREERAAELKLLEELHNDRPDTELDYLLATAQEFRGDLQSSRVSWERAAKLQPAWLGHRFEQAWFELRQNHLLAARQIARDMLRLDGNSPWSKLAASTSQVPEDVVLASRTDASTPADSPVFRHFELLLKATDSAHRRDFTQTDDLLRQAASAIHFETPFLFDAFDWCLAEDEPTLAFALSNMPEWPHDSIVARAKLARLSNLPPTEERSAHSTRHP